MPTASPPAIAIWCIGDCSVSVLWSALVMRDWRTLLDDGLVVDFWRSDGKCTWMRRCLPAFLLAPKCHASGVFRHVLRACLSSGTFFPAFDLFRTARTRVGTDLSPGEWQVYTVGMFGL